MSRDLIKPSKFLSLVLRHEPERIGLALDEQGWADIGELIEKAGAHGVALTCELVAEVVATSDKQRFIIDDSGQRIRANHGHSVDVDLGLEPQVPPAVLYHGTAVGNLCSIRAGGLQAARRQYVHLSPDEATARKVGRRHGPPAVLRIQAGRMWAKGLEFFRSANGVWLTRAVPPDFVEFPDEKA
jgi:putative RNA 2'-phosphotransferase